MFNSLGSLVEAVHNTVHQNKTLKSYPI